MEWITSRIASSLIGAALMGNQTSTIMNCTIDVGFDFLQDPRLAILTGRAVFTDLTGDARFASFAMLAGRTRVAFFPFVSLLTFLAIIASNSCFATLTTFTAGTNITLATR
jgi:hypothetical protein